MAALINIVIKMYKIVIEPQEFKARIIFLKKNKITQISIDVVMCYFFNSIAK